MKYATIVADPPWPMRFGGPRNGRHLRKLPYETMSLEEIGSLRVEDVAGEDAHLYLWTPHSWLPYSFGVAQSWGFSYHCTLTWCKPVGHTPFSWMFSTEFCLFCRRGSLPLRKMGKRQDFTGKLGGHSAKPDSFYDLVEEVSPGPYLEMFARRQRLGWDTWGDEALEHVVVSSVRTATGSAEDAEPVVRPARPGAPGADPVSPGELRWPS